MNHKKSEKVIKEQRQKLIDYLGDNYQVSDDALINIYSETYAFYTRLKDEIANSELLMEYTNKAGATNHVKNPLAIELTKTVQVLNNLLKSLGLTAAQRKRVIAEDGDEFENF